MTHFDVNERCLTFPTSFLTILPNFNGFLLKLPSSVDFRSLFTFLKTFFVDVYRDFPEKWVVFKRKKLLIKSCLNLTLLGSMESPFLHLSPSVNIIIKNVLTKRDVAIFAEVLLTSRSIFGKLTNFKEEFFLMKIFDST